MKRRFFLGIVFILIFIEAVFAVEPFGAVVSPGTPSRAPQDAPQSIAAYAGNVTPVNIQGYSSTQSWQGYFGNITGTIQLADSSDNVLYNWSLASPRGEVFASKNNSITWGNVQCLNFTATGNFSNGGETAGATNLNGTNMSRLETEFNISSSDVDGVNETFNLLGAGTHDSFYVNNLEFSEGECRSARIFDNTGQGVNNKFEEVLLYEPTSTSVIFGAILEDNAQGFDQGTHDFEMMVLENGHGTDTTATTYYFYVELE